MDKIIYYLEGRPEAHHIHKKLALSLNAKPIYVDNVVRWQDKNYPNYLLPFIWLINAIGLLKYRNADMILVDNLHATPIIAQYLGVLRKKTKLVCHLGSHTLYFTYSGEFNKRTKWIHQNLLRKYDALMCEGQMAIELAKNLAHDAKVYYSFLGLGKDTLIKLGKSNPDFYSKKILFIGNVESDFRYKYKGVDLILKGLQEYNENNDNSLSIDIIGKWEDSFIAKGKAILGNQINFLGYMDFYNQLNNYYLYLHCSRGDAFPTTSLEAMNAGLIPILSKWTGTKEIIEDIDQNIICDLSINSISIAISYVTNMSLEDKMTLSERIRKNASGYSFDKAQHNYIDSISRIMTES